MSVDSVVLGVDLGTTATKVLAVTADGSVRHLVERENPLSTDQSGAAFQDAALIRDRAVETVRECVRWADEHGHPVAALAFSSAMHTLLGLDAEHRPATPAFNWADTQSSAVANRLRADPSSAALHQATGTPVHTQSVMVKLAWLTAERPDLTSDVGRWCALKDFVLAEFTGELVTEYSIASGTGLQDMHSLSWYGPALDVAGIDRDHLPSLAAPTDTRPLAPGIARHLGLAPGLPVVLGGGDGPLANLGVGAVTSGVAALTLGTSGALRVIRDRPGVDDRCRTFSYALADGLWVMGGSVSNGAVVGQWAAETFGIELGELLNRARDVEPGAAGLVALPYLLGERAPWWEAGLTGALIGMRRVHGPAEVTRALVEGVAQQLALVCDTVRDTGVEVRAVRTSGGGFRSPIWGEVIAAALNTELAMAEGGSALGAALLGWRVLGVVDSLADAAALVRTRNTVAPDPEMARLMGRRRPLLERLHDALDGFALDTTDQ